MLNGVVMQWRGSVGEDLLVERPGRECEVSSGGKLLAWSRLPDTRGSLEARPVCSTTTGFGLFVFRGETGDPVEIPGDSSGGLTKGHAYIEIGIAWCRDTSNARCSLSRVSRGEKT